MRQRPASGQLQLGTQIRPHGGVVGALPVGADVTEGDAGPHTVPRLAAGAIGSQDEVYAGAVVVHSGPRGLVPTGVGLRPAQEQACRCLFRAAEAGSCVVRY